MHLNIKESEARIRKARDRSTRNPAGWSSATFGADGHWGWLDSVHNDARGVPVSFPSQTDLLITTQRIALRFS
ncbi:LOW QUALITY PROTEIN: hypothetical protein NC653_025735 [Populus alba x Populus x berolinensis]|uniref:Uncharacterized protein n=1 Tax=Populus alba x Populus x berolinensis TaxID=444605 RepID=A0AAD6MC08_9ROSI|nr:LOW QUALITY PROTEIN: hypothetical protein NC653_025735 [Populus alba x Populus x berolinensis]